MRGRILIVEGPDGSGKTTLISRLSQHEGLNPRIVRCPGVAMGYDYRSFILGNANSNRLLDTFLFLSSLIGAAEEVILPAYQNGETVLVDRYLPSTMVYQGLPCRVLSDPEDLLGKLQMIFPVETMSFFRVLDLAHWIYLRPSPELITQRLSQRDQGEVNRLDPKSIQQTIDQIRLYDEVFETTALKNSLTRLDGTVENTAEIWGQINNDIQAHD